MVDLVEAAQSGPSRKCWAQSVDDELAEQLAEVRRMVDDGEPVTFRAVHRALVEAGVQIGRKAVENHLQRGCTCD